MMQSQSSSGVVLVIAPHPDDAELGMGGTIAKLLQRGVKVVVADLTDGEPTPYGSPEIRAAETKEASKVLGLVDRRMLGIKNRELFDTVENRKLVAGIIREVRPDILFAPYWTDAHPDHVQACALIEAARFYAKFVKSDLPHQPHFVRRIFHFFSTHMRVQISPSFIYDVSGVVEQKIQSILAYKSQFVAHTSNAARIEVIRREALFWGDQIGTEGGEPFLCREPIKITEPGALLAL